MSLWKASADARQVRDAAVRLQTVTRSNTAEAVENDLPAPVRLTGITGKALTTWASQWVPRRALPDAPAGWDWEAIYAKFARTPDRFELSIWSDEDLCGLAVGAPRGKNTGTYLGVTHVEGRLNPPHPLSGFVMPIVLQAATAYAFALGIRQLRMIDPFADLIPYYCERFGFRSVVGPNNRVYCVKEVPHV